MKKLNLSTAKASSVLVWPQTYGYPGATGRGRPAPSPAFRWSRRSSAGTRLHHYLSCPKAVAAVITAAVISGLGGPMADHAFAGDGKAVSQDAAAGWPQYRGPNRDNIAVNSPKLLDAWPTNGPKLVWGSDWIPGWYQGGCSGPVVADGKVFVYSTWKQPVGGGNLYRLITPEYLANAGWVADLPADLAKKIEEARASPKRPRTYERGGYFVWWGLDPKEKDREREEYLTKKPELAKYIKDFVATLDPKEAEKYGDCIKKRLCTTPGSVFGEANGLTWDGLEQLSKLQGVGYSTLREWAGFWGGATHLPTLAFHLDNDKILDAAWKLSFTRSDTLVCLDAATGKTLWKKNFPLDSEAVSNLKQEGHTDVLGVVATPAVWNGKCYFAGAAGLYCVSAKDGAPIWRVRHKPEQASPLVADGVVYHCGSAYNAETGQLLWKSSRPGDSNFGASLVAFGGPSSPGGPTGASKKYIFAQGGGNTMCCLDLQTGEEMWTLKCPSTWTMEVQVSGDVLIAQGKMYKMTPTGIQPIKTLVEFPGMTFGLSWIIYQNHLYQYVFAAEGSRPDKKADGLCCWDLKSGDLKWAYRGPTCTWDTDYTPAILADGKIFAPFGSNGKFMWENDDVAMYQPTPEKYVLLGSFKAGLIPWTPMAFAGGKLFVRTEAGISCYDLAQH